MTTAVTKRCWPTNSCTCVNGGSWARSGSCGAISPPTPGAGPPAWPTGRPTRQSRWRSKPAGWPAAERNSLATTEAFGLGSFPHRFPGPSPCRLSSAHGRSPVSDQLAPVEALEAAKPSVTPRGRLVDLWHRIRSGEDPVAFGAVVAVVAVAAGLVWFWAGARAGGVPAASATPRSAIGDGPPAGGPPSSLAAHNGDRTSTTGSPLAVHVAGAVARPGLYHLPAGSRVADALARAGGKLPP